MTAERSIRTSATPAIGTSAQRLALALARLPVGAAFFETDTGHAFVVGVAPGSDPNAPTLAWTQTDGTGGAGFPLTSDVSAAGFRIERGGAAVAGDDFALLQQITAAQAGAVPTSRTLTAGAGLTGGGTLAANRSFAVGANADGSIVVNATDVQVGVLATDAQHGARGGGTQHAAAVASGAAGFMTGADKAKLDAIPGSAGLSTPGLDPASLLQGDLSLADWDQAYPSDRVKCRARAAAITALDGNTYLDAVWLNFDGAAAGRGYKCYRWAAPNTGTATASVVARRSAGAASIVIALASSTGVVAASTVCVLGVSDATFTVSAAAVAATEYQVVVSCNDAAGLGGTAQAQAYVSRVRVQVSGGTGVFANSGRVAALPTNLGCDSERTPFDRYYLASACPVLGLTTTATSIVVEYASTLVATPLFDNIGVLVGVPGQTPCDPIAAIAPSAAGVVQQAAVTLPAGLKRVEVVGSPTQFATPNQATFVRAVYYPLTEQMAVTPPGGARRLVIGPCDSIGVGSMIPRAPSALQGWAQLVRTRFPGDVAFEGAASLRLVNLGYLYVGGVLQNDSARQILRRSFVERLSSFKPTDIYCQIGFNDWSFGSTASDFGLEYALMLDDVHAANPWAHVTAQGMTTSPFETTANAGGATMVDLRAQIATVATARNPWCTYLNGLTLVSAANLGDGIHPNVTGAAEYANNVCAYYVI